MWTEYVILTLTFELQNLEVSSNLYSPSVYEVSRLKMSYKYMYVQCIWTDRQIMIVIS